MCTRFLKNLNLQNGEYKHYKQKWIIISFNDEICQYVYRIIKFNIFEEILDFNLLVQCTVNR